MANYMAFKSELSFLHYLMSCSLTTSMTSKKKRKKMKINPHRPTGIRTVFDTDGEGLPPLATLAEMKTGSGLLQFRST